MLHWVNININSTYVYGTVYHCNSWKQKTNLMLLAILFHFLCAQHVSDINISIIRILRLFCWITTLVVCSWFDVCWCFGVVGLEWYPCYRLQPVTPNLQHTSNQEHTTNVVIQQNIRKLLIMDILMSETCWAYKKWNKNCKWHQVGLLFSYIPL